MCGILGCWSPRKINQTSIEKMLGTLHHRGPDGRGIWLDQNHHVALGHTRLAIIDLSAEGHQPMQSASGRYVMVFNGEIYNFQTIKQDLEKASSITFRGHSDTEVLLAAIEFWGLQVALEKSVGMFAIALWDREQQCLHLARDRFGEKPLYYGKVGQDFVFASELKALRQHPHWQGEIDRHALTAFLRYSYVPTPLCIFKGIAKLEPGSVITLLQNGESKSTTYWSAKETAYQGRQNLFDGSYEEAKSQLERLLNQSIAEKMIADVPLGALLSGGIDSSTVVALMQQQSKQPVHTFSIGFNEDEYNEAHHAKAVATHLGTAHTELYLTGQDCLDVVPKLPDLYDEPFADASQIPTFLVCQLARQSVTVALSGDGGDELFCGYNRYFRAPPMWEKIRRIPYWARCMLFSAMGVMPRCGWDALYAMGKQVLPKHYHAQAFGNKMHKLIGSLKQAKQPYDLFRHYSSVEHHPERLVLGGQDHDFMQQSYFKDLGFVEGMMLSDAEAYLMDDILVKVDRASMGVSLESRVPFIDHRVFEYAWQLPLQHKLNQGAGKQILRDILYQYVPRELIERPKMGFGIPLAQWLRGELKPWAEALLSDSALISGNLLDVRLVRRYWQQHLSGDHDWSSQLWNILMFQAWQRGEP